jgi:hypothetical protein
MIYFSVRGTFSTFPPPQQLEPVATCILLSIRFSFRGKLSLLGSCPKLPCCPTLNQLWWFFLGLLHAHLGKLDLPLWFQRLYEQCFFFKWICVLSHIEFLQFIIFSFDENLHSFHFCLEKSKYLKSITLSWDSFKINIEIPNQTSMI